MVKIKEGYWTAMSTGLPNRIQEQVEAQGPTIPGAMLKPLVENVQLLEEMTRLKIQADAFQLKLEEENKGKGFRVSQKEREAALAASQKLTALKTAAIGNDLLKGSEKDFLGF